MNDQEIIKACPICGRPIEHHCWHGEHEIGSIQMPKSEAAEMMRKYLVCMKVEVDLFESSLERLIKS